MKTLLRKLYGVFILVRLLGPLIFLLLLVVMGLYGYQQLKNTISQPLAGLQQEISTIKKDIDAVGKDIDSVVKVSKDAANGLSQVTGTVTGSVGTVIGVFDSKAGKTVASSGKQLGKELTKEVSKLKKTFTNMIPGVDNLDKIVKAIKEFFSSGWLLFFLIIYLLTVLLFISAYLEFLYFSFSRIPQAWKMVVAKEADYELAK